MDNRNTGELIRKLRTDKGMTQQQLADKLNVTTAAVSKWERGKGFPDVSLLEKLAEELGVSISDLVKGKVTQEENNEDEVIKKVVNESEKQSGSKLLFLKSLLLICLAAGIWFVTAHAIIGQTESPQIVNFEFVDTGIVYLHLWSPKTQNHNYNALKTVTTKEKDHTLYIKCKFVNWNLFFKQNDKVMSIKTDGDIDRIIVYGLNNQEITIYENGLIISPQARILADKQTDDLLIVEACTDDELSNMIYPLNQNQNHSEIQIKDSILHIDIKQNLSLEQPLIESKFTRYSSMVMAILKDLKKTEITYQTTDGIQHVFEFTRQQAEQFVGIGLFCEFDGTPYQTQRLLNELEIRNTSLTAAPEINVRIPGNE